MLRFIYIGIAFSLLLSLNIMVFMPSDDLLNSIPRALLWVMDLTKIDVGLTMIFNAYVVRFLIRRIHII
jgi:hypothetical protein